MRANPDGSILRLRDVARVELGAQNYFTIGRLNKDDATVILLYQTPTANALSTADAVKATMEKLKANFPPGLDYSVSYDSTLNIKDSIHDVVDTLRDAFILVALVVFVFLGSFRTALIPMLAVPVSLIGTFAAFIPLGIQLQHANALRAGARGRDRGRRRHRRRRGCASATSKRDSLRSMRPSGR